MALWTVIITSENDAVIQPDEVQRPTGRIAATGLPLDEALVLARTALHAETRIIAQDDTTGRTEG